MMASIFFTERLPAFSDFRVQMASKRVAQLVRSAPATDRDTQQWSKDDHMSGFLKSRVYAKLLKLSISECFQPFNGQILEIEQVAYSSLSTQNRQIDETMCRRMPLEVG